MQFSPRTLPSFTLALSSRRNSFNLPDYYRSTRIEHYGPYMREVEAPQDFMKTIDLRDRDDYESDSCFVISAIFEEDEEVGTESLSTHETLLEEREPPKTLRRRLGEFLDFVFSKLRPCYGRQAKDVEVVNSELQVNVCD